MDVGNDDDLDTLIKSSRSKSVIENRNLVEKKEEERKFRGMRRKNAIRTKAEKNCRGCEEYKKKLKKASNNNPYPITIVLDRYSGVYSKGLWTAWNCYPQDVPSAPSMDDVTCNKFWDFDPKATEAGVGKSPIEALLNLQSKLAKEDVNPQVISNVNDEDLEF